MPGLSQSLDLKMMAAIRPLDDKERESLKSSAAEVERAFRECVKNTSCEFNSVQPLIRKFTDSVEEVLEKGRQLYSGIYEKHNELFIAETILKKTDVIRLEYEPKLNGCRKSIDFRATTDDGYYIYVDVKTIAPINVDRWDQYETARREEWLAPNTDVLLAKEFDGGPMWHWSESTRSKFLDHTLEFEEKIVKAKLAFSNTRFVMSFCGEGSFWTLDELEDFASFYMRGSHRLDDSFSKMESKDMADRSLKLKGVVSGFACVSGPNRWPGERRIVWDVQPPDDGF